MQLYNTLNRKKETFKPLSAGKASVYNCGPTVYDHAHIGNLRTYVFTDTLRRVLEAEGFAVRQVMNVTDIGHLTDDADSGEDKMLKGLKREGKPITLSSMRELAEKYVELFVGDLKKLNILMPHEMPRASDHIKEDIEIIKILEEKGATYKTSDGIYFDISAFPEYGKLGNIDVESLKSGARVEENSEKRQSADFALWKFSKTDGLGFESPWGTGFPGWHIECSAMAKKYLGQPVDIHTGGIDHIGTHHNGEIAQSELAYGEPLANYWLHGNHLIFGEGKMAKSGEGFITLDSVRNKGIHPLSLRFWFLQAHYQSPLSFSYEALEAAQSGLTRLLEKVSNLPEESGKPLNKFMIPFMASLSDNLNTPEALGTVFELLDSEEEGRDIKATLHEMDKVLGLSLEIYAKKIKDLALKTLPEEIQTLQKKRDVARQEKNWKLSDEIRAQIESLGFSVKDTDGGTVVSPRFSLLDL